MVSTADSESDSSVGDSSNRSIPDDSALKQLKSDAMNPYYIHSNENSSIFFL